MNSQRRPDNFFGRRGVSAYRYSVDPYLATGLDEIPHVDEMTLGIHSCHRIYVHEREAPISIEVRQRESVALKGRSPKRLPTQHCQLRLKVAPRKSQLP